MCLPLVASPASLRCHQIISGTFCHWEFPEDELTSGAPRAGTGPAHSRWSVTAGEAAAGRKGLCPKAKARQLTGLPVPHQHCLQRSKVALITHQ